MTNEELALAAQCGDKPAESELIKRLSPMVKSISARFFLSGGTEEDLFEEGMLGLLSAIKTYSAGNASFTTYAHACVRNSVIDAVKKSLGAKHSALNNFVPLVEISGEFPADPEDEIFKIEQRSEFLQKISKLLSSFEFKVTVMYLDGLSVAEIAQSLSRSAKSAGNALARAKAKLIACYSCGRGDR